MSTFFGKILDVPIDYLIRTLQSHDWEHCECTDYFLCWEHCNKIDLENSEYICNVLGGVRMLSTQGTSGHLLPSSTLLVLA